MAIIYTYTVQYQGVQYINAKSTSVHNVHNFTILSVLDSYWTLQVIITLYKYFFKIAMLVYFMAYRTILFRMDNF